jgi:5-methylcytosine-specific restriction endonuclease McrA
MRDNTYLVERNPATSLEARKKISKRKLEVNWMRGRTKELSPNYCGGKTSYRGFDWNNIKRRVKERDEFKCVSCGLTEKENLKLTGQVLQVDHIIPYRVTEDNSMKNLQTLCNKCHGEKLKIDLPIMKASLSYK